MISVTVICRLCIEQEIESAITKQKYMAKNNQTTLRKNIALLLIAKFETEK